MEWVYRHFPIPTLHSKAQKEGEALECAAEQGGNEGFWAYSDALYSTTKSNNSLDIGVYNTGNQPQGSLDAGQLSDFAAQTGLDKAAFEQCLASGKHAERVERDTIEAGEAGGQGTPYIVFISKGRVPSETRELLDSLIPSVGPNTFAISKDGKRISMSGALPFTIVDQLLATLLK